jgi:cell division protein DivIC
MSKKNNRNKSDDKKNGKRARIYGILLLLFVGTILSVQMARLYKKKQEYKQEEASLIKEKEALEKKQEDLIRYEEYTKTDEYIEDTAFEKLGMIKGNWIIFKEQD